jgi:ribonuclease H / adenosylcobalamin/alpha-ribazole phosphatase
MFAEPTDRNSPEPPRWFPPTETATRILLVRHGTTVHSHEGRFSGRNDLPLDPHGVAQARALAGYIATLEPLDAVISSPLRRAWETAQAIVERVGGQVEIHEDLIEAEFGEWEGLTITEAHLKSPQQLADWLNAANVAPPDGESFVDVEARARRAIDEIVAAHRHQRVAVVSHVTPIKTLLCAALGAPPETMFRFHLDTASLSIVDYYDDGTSSVRIINHAGHPSEPPQTATAT